MSRAAVAVLLTALLVLLGVPAHADTAAFTKVSEWSGGYTGQFTVTNTGNAQLNGWTVGFDLPSGTSVGSYWDALLTRTGDHYEFKNREYNGTLAPGATATFGWVASGNGAPQNCTLNGKSCAGAPDTTPPSVPTGLTVSGATGTSLTVGWNASSDNTGVTGYDLVRDNGSPTTVTGTSTTVTGLSPNTSYSFKVRARDAAGNVSAYSSAVTGKTTDGGGTPPPPSGTIRFAPYIDITMNTPSLTSAASATGVKNYTLAFALGDSTGCNPAWGGTIALDDQRIINDVRALQQSGGQVVVATGGAAGPYLEQSCGDTASLLAAYEKILDTVKTNNLDVDIEASIDIPKVNAALKQLQQARGTTISYTMRVQGQDYGMDPYSIQILQDAASRGLNVGVNPMLMDFGYSGDWGDAMVSAATASLAQMKQIWPGKSDAELKSLLGVTPMIGKNDSGMTTTQAAAQKLHSWAVSNNIGFIRFWSVGRDNGGCPNGQVSPTCSGVSQSPYEFTGILKY
ncbi:cellulose binding domain-containing protein [Actinomadura gamaensis]|uniref:Cellulose binding domain-containing protein n=1 Tax=Actinomadura gamaensis TaxID=1763541 RepID=A0ABV9TQI0_9ACTN